jgi:hypothetical protein
LALPKDASKLSITAHLRLPEYAPGGVVISIPSRGRFGKKWLDCELGSFCVWPPIPGMIAMSASLSIPHPDPDGTQRYEVTFLGNSVNPGDYFPLVRLALTYTMPGPLCRVGAINAGLIHKAPTTTELLIPREAKILEWSDFVAPGGSDQWKKCDHEKTTDQCGKDYRLQSGWFVEDDKSDGAHGRLWSCGNETDHKVLCRMDLTYDPGPADSSKKDQEKQDVPPAEP